MGYRSVDQLEQFEFHDSDWKLNSRDGDAVAFAVENLNIHKDTEQNGEEWDMELSPARMTFRGFRLICFEPGRTWTTDETGKSVPVGPRVLYTGEEGMDLLAKESFQVFHLKREGDHWEIGCCGVEPYFTVEFDFDSVEITWDSYEKKAWYELHRYYPFQATLDTPDGAVREKLAISVHEEDLYRVGVGWIKGPSVTAGIQWNGKRYLGDGNDEFLWTDALADLQRKLPEGVTIRGCLTCRYGNLCPCGNEPGKVYCLRGEAVTCKMDVVRFFDGDDWVQRKKAYFDFCEDWEAVSADHYTYNDFGDEH